MCFLHAQVLVTNVTPAPYVLSINSITTASNLETPPKTIEIDKDMLLSADDISLLRSRGLPIVE